MNVNLLENKLGTKCIISLNLENGLLSILSKYREKIDASFYRIDGEYYLKLFISKDESGGSLPYSLMSNAVMNDMGYFISVQISLSDDSGINLFFPIIDYPSVLVDHIYLQDSKIFMEFRFHTSMNSGIIEVLDRMNKFSEEYSLVYFGQEHTWIQDLNALSESDSVKVLQISTKLESYSNFIVNIAKNNPDAIYIPELRSRNNNGVRVLVFSENPVNSKEFKTISSSSGIYEFIGNDSLIELNRSQAMTNEVPRNTVFYRVRGDRLVDTSIISTPFAHRFLRNYLQTFQNIKGGEPIIEYFCDLKKETWEYL